MAQRIQDRVGPFSKRTLQSIEAGRPVHLRSIRLVAEELGHDVTALMKAPGTVPHNLPPPLTSFVGRTQVLAEVTAHLEASRFLTLTGPGGCGKSRLALEVARDLLPDHPDGVWLVELASLTTPALVPQAVAAALGVREGHERNVTELLREHLANRVSLLILDNCEHLLSACARLIGDLLPVCQRLRFLATSRESLSLDGEATYLVPPLQLPDEHDQLGELQGVESVRLLVERAAAVRSDFSLSGSNASAVGEICRHLDGIPLALELAAARVKTMPIHEINERLADRFHLLTDGHRATLSQHRTLRALIDWSHDHLSDDERVLLRRLSVFGDGWTLPAAESVCVGGNIEKDAVVDLLSHLVSKSLVELDSHGGRGTGKGRYRLLETMRQYALERLVEGGEERDVRRRHRRCFMALAEEAEPQLDGPDQQAWLSLLQDENGNLRAAAKVRVDEREDESEERLRLAGALGLFWEVCGYRSEGRAICTELLDSSEPDGRSTIRAKVLRTAGRLALLLGKTSEARTRFEDSLRMSRELACGSGIASSLNELGVLATDQGDFAEARKLLGESVAIRKELGDRCGVANTLMNLGVVARKQGDHDQARSLFEESLAIRRNLGDRRGIAMVLANLGNVAFGRCDFATAHRLYEEGLVMFRELGDKHGVASTLNNLGNVAKRRHDYVAARTLYEDGLAICRELGDKRGTARALQNLGSMALNVGEHTKARSLSEESLDMFRELGDMQGVAQVLGNLGIVARHQGLHAEARARSEDSLAISRKQGDKQGIAEALGELALVACGEGDLARATTLCSQSLSICREMGDTGGMAECLVSLGCIAGQEHRLDRAIRLLASGRTAAEHIAYVFSPSTQERFEASLSVLRARVDAETFDREWSAGQAMHPDRAIEYALDESAPGVPTS